MATTFTHQVFLSSSVSTTYYHGDGREEDYYSSKYRTSQQFTIDTAQEDFEVRYQRDIGETIREVVDTFTGIVIEEERKTAPLTDLSYSNKRVINNTLYFDATCASANPLQPGAPDINYSVTISVTREGDVKISGVNDGFPGYEFWRKIGLNLPELIWSHNPIKTGETLASLYGSGEHIIEAGKLAHTAPNNSVSLTSDFIPKGHYNRPGTFMTPKFITVHNTANTAYTANARMHANYVKNITTNVSWHFTVDDKAIIYQHLPIFEIGYHAGDSQGNQESIGIEICENAGSNFEQAVKNAQALIRMLMKQTGIPIMNVVPHQFWSGKNCPRLLLDRWDSFVQGILDSTINLSETKDSSDPADYLTGPYAILPGDTGPAVVQLQRNLIGVGESLETDGSYGPATESAVRSFQQRHGLTVDGNAGPQTQAKLADVLKSALTPGDTGSDVVRLQNNLISAGEVLEADGSYGPATERAVRSFQQRYGLTVDGNAGPQTQSKLAEILSSALTLGDTGSAVIRLQNNLISAGETLEADGSYGPATEIAVRSFQQRYGLIVDGMAGPQTQGKLREVVSTESNSALLPGDSGPAVAQLQRNLINAGETLSYGVDGSYGPETERAIRSFQQRFGLTVDGMAGPQTQGKLMEVLSSAILPGETGAAVAELQRNLMRVGETLPHGVDGSYGPETESAVRAFQQKYGLTVDGLAGPQTQSKLTDILREVKIALLPGDTGSAVANLQRNLLSIGITVTGGVDGSYGPGTESAIRYFQQKYGLFVDGMAGPQTQAKLADLLSN